jgi:hypothetical protein
MRTTSWVLAGFVVLAASDAQAANPTRAEVVEALRKATLFLRESIADHGGYAWTSSVDGRFSQGEGVAGPDTIWVQPPGTPAVGLALLDAYEATGDAIHLLAAQEAADALVQGQLRSGGWHYRIEFDPAKRREFVYRDDPRGGRADIVPTPAPGGWDVWKQRRIKGNQTILDDDTTPAALRLLMRVDQALGFRNALIHEAVQYALESLRNAQHPIGAWSHNYDHFPTEPPDEAHYPIRAASYPDTWSRTWTKDFTGGYVINDRITLNGITTLLLAHRIYGDPRDLACAERGGRFLKLAQMPAPQPAWAQQYNRQMQPVWDRAFEPPAITGLESQDVLETLLTLHEATGDREWLEPIPSALAYLKTCRRPDGTLARFYELKTNRPLYLTRDYRLTDDPSNVPDHYGFVVPSRLDAIEAEYHRALSASPDAAGREPTPSLTPQLIAQTRGVLDAQDARGAWAEPGTVRDPNGRKLAPAEGVIQSQTFINHVGTLRRYLQALPSQ